MDDRYDEFGGTAAMLRQMEFYTRHLPHVASAGGYYNTNGERGEVLARSEKQCGKQEREVLGLFTDRPGRWLSPEDVHNLMNTYPPLTSVRRAITNLEIRGKLVKSERPMVMGAYGKMIHCWRRA